MAPSPQLAAAGSSTYSSDIYHAGDGTWDASRDTYLLPNLQTLPLKVTQYNGMGNRFRGLSEYHTLIKGHGVLAAITFLGVVPAAIMIARFYRRNPRMAMRLHIWLQILTLFLVTIVFILGNIAVGPRRSLTNPHHDIGLTIYVLVWFQILWGWLSYRIEKKKQRYKMPLKIMIHQWLGRATALLALAQIGTGITLYGSPKALFVLYALALALLILIYFYLSYRFRDPLDGGAGSSYYTGSIVEERRDHSPSRHRGLKALLGLGAAGAAVAALRGRRRSQEARTEVTESHVSSQQHHRPGSRHASRHRPSSSYVDEKYTQHDRQQNHTWRDRLLGAAAVGGTLAVVKGLMDRRKRRDDATAVSVDSYGHPVGGATTITEDDVSRVEAGHAPTSPATPRIYRPGVAAAMTPGTSPLRRPGPRQSRDSVSSYADLADNRQRTRHHATRDTVAALGVAGYVRHLWNKRGQRQEDQRVEGIRRQDRIQEDIARRNSNRRRFTGDGSPNIRRYRPPAAGGSLVSLDDSAISGSNPGLSRHDYSRTGVSGPPVMSGPSTAAITASQIISPPPSNIPMPPPPGSMANAQYPPPPPVPVGHAYEESGSEAYMSASGEQHRRHRLRDEAALAGAAGVGTAAAVAADHSYSAARVNSPPVSVKVKMHNDGRHVTLRRLNEQEAAAERESRRRERNRRDGSLSSVEGGRDSAEERWRRTEAMEAAQAAAGAQQSTMIPPPPGAHIPMPMPMPPQPPQHAPFTAAQQAQAMNLPPPPMMPGSALAGSGMSPPSTGPYGTETDLSNYENNRRRRRAERVKAKAAQQGRDGRGVEFQ